MFGPSPMRDVFHTIICELAAAGYHLDPPGPRDSCVRLRASQLRTCWDAIASALLSLRGGGAPLSLAAAARAWGGCEASSLRRSVQMLTIGRALKG